jgi:hypothetical protein
LTTWHFRISIESEFLHFLSDLDMHNIISGNYGSNGYDDDMLYHANWHDSKSHCLEIKTLMFKLLNSIDTDMKSEISCDRRDFVAFSLEVPCPGSWRRCKTYP